MAGGCMSDQEMMDESSIHKIIKECLVQQEASLKVVISGHVEKLESQIQELKKLLILHLNNSTTTTTMTTPADHDLQPEALDGSLAAAAVGDDDDNYEAEEPQFGGGEGSIEDEHLQQLGVSKLKVASVPLPPAASSPTWKYDIFISFRGDDTRRGFASHLFHALKNADLNCYRDVDGDERGQVVGPMLIDAIHHSMMAIILLSKNYADSKWCLQELVEILRFNKLYRTYGHTVLPIFYDVEPSDVRNQYGSVGEAFKRCKGKTKQEKEQWRDALVEAGNLSSWHLVNDANGDEAQFIERIVEELQNRVFYSRNAYFVKSPVGMKDNVNNLISLLDTPSKGTSISKVGIYGTEGIGKTTLAKLICRKLYVEFEGRVSLLENIHDVNINEEAIVRLQTKLVQDVMKIRRPLLLGNKVKNVSEIRKRLYQRKVLLVLDGIEKPHELLSIIGGEPEKFLHPGSIILITTQNKQLLEDLKVDIIDMIPPLNPQDSLRLFYQHAFIDEPVEVADVDTSRNLVHYAGGIPLALQTLGSFLFDKPKDEWHLMLGKLVRSPRLDLIGVYSNSVSPLYTYKKVAPCERHGIPYDHGKLTTIRKIILVLGKNLERIYVRHMIVDYDYNGSFISFGGSPGFERSGFWQVTLGYPDEYLTKVSVYIDEDYQFGAIRSIIFHSNKREYGPYGEESETYITFQDSGSIIGFFGSRGDSHLVSIGAYFGPVPNPSPSTTAGPFGGCKGKRWNDGKHLDIRRIDVLVGDSVIKSICITYDNYGHPLGPFTHGDESDAHVAHLVKLDYPYEYLIAISGYEGGGTNGKDVVVRSLTFHSNRRKYGPFGDENGQRFITPQSSGVKIVGFFGRDAIGLDGGLESIGVHLEAVSHVHPKTVVGPFGGQTGEIWDHGDFSGDIRKMLISWGSNGVISVSRVDDDLYNYRSGVAASTSSKLIQLDYPREYINAMEGWFQVEPNGDAVIKELTFKTNMATYGPYGDTNNITYGTYFRTPWNVGKITGFYGSRSEDRLSSIGAYFGPVYHDHPLKNIGPFGDYFSGTQWDDGSHVAVKQINLRCGAIIDFISLVYVDANWESLPGKMHGGAGGYPTEIVLDYPNEYLVAMTGHVGTFGDELCVRSLSFETNKRKFGPYGAQEGNYFSIRSNIGKIVGFYGSSSNYLLSIGAHIQLL